MKAGPTGDFPKGKMNSSDEGGLNIKMGVNAEGKFILYFGSPVVWIGMDKEEAFQFAKAIMSHVVDKYVRIDS